MRAKGYAGVILVVLTAVAIGVVVVVSSESGRPATKRIQSPATNASFVTEDGVKIVGVLSFPNSSEGRFPVVVLVHQFGGNRHQWDGFIPHLLGMGYAVLAYDIRGFGGSATMVSNGQMVPFQASPTYLDDMVKDVAAALKWLSGQPQVDQSRIAIVGASVGANIAFVSSGAFPQIKTAVSLSPSNTRGPLMGRNVPNFAPKNIFFLSDDVEQADAKALFDLSGEPRQVRAYPGAGHGISILGNATAVQDIFSWLRSNLG